MLSDIKKLSSRFWMETRKAGEEAPLILTLLLFLWQTPRRLLPTWTFFTIALAWISRIPRRREPQSIASDAFVSEP